MVCGLLYGIWAAGYKGCSICGLLNGKWAPVRYVGFCTVCGLNYMWAVEWYLDCYSVCLLL